ncbi:MAG: MGMT family protein [bacterium]|nr:MGMT family protein [bacterium]
MGVFQEIYRIVKRIPKGRAASYGWVARQAGIGDARVVGWALHANDSYERVPCYRVVRKDGKLADNYAHGGAEKQRRLLEKEGVRFDKRGRVRQEFLVNSK